MGVASTLLGPGDDAAVVAVPDGRVVATTDLLVENRHFRRDWSTANDIGHKAAARNFADIAAMGAVPTALLLGFATPGDVALEWVDGLMAGLREECGEVGAAIIGGDVTAADVITLGVTALGDLQGREPVTLGGARPGDVVALAGKVGWAAAGFAVLGRGFRSPVQVVSAHRRPEPPYAEGPRAAELGASAMTDVSDGLVADLGSSHPAGVLALSWLGLGLVCGLAGDVRALLGDVVIAAVCCALAALFAGLLLAVVHAGGATGWAAVRGTLPAGVGDALLALAVIPLVRAFLLTQTLRARRALVPELDLGPRRG